MSAGLFALLDDVAMIAKAAASSLDDVTAVAAKASGKAVTLVIDDAAVTPQYVTGIKPARELPIIAKIAKGSLVNKAIVLVVALTLNYFLPAALGPILLLGGSYLCFEGAEKILGRFLHHQTQVTDKPLHEDPDAEKRVVSSAIRTDLILSTEIMVVALNEVKDQSLAMQLGALIVVALAITALVYGVVALLVKLDDLGLALTKRRRTLVQTLGRVLLKAMPLIMTTLSVVGVAAMIWVGGHLAMVNLADLGLGIFHHWVITAEHAVVAAVPATISGALGWLTDTAGALLFGFLWGALLMLIVTGVTAVVKKVRI